MPAEQLDIHTQPALVDRVGERAGEGAGEQQLVVQPDTVHQRQVGQIRHHDAGAAVRVLPAHAAVPVVQPIAQRRGEPVLQPWPALEELVEHRQPVGPDTAGRDVPPDPGPVGGPVHVLAANLDRLDQGQPCGGGHARPANAAS